MSNSELFHIKDDKEDVLKRPILLMFNIQDKEDDEIKEEQNIVLSKQKQDLEVDTTSSSRELENEEEKDEDDGFRTPTHFENRIQMLKQCPLAPRKTKPHMKRKKAQCKQLLDVSREVELLFQIKHKTFSSSQQSTKKARRE